MTAVWTPKRERRAIAAHLVRCRFCAGLLAHGRRRRDRELLEAAETLAEEHMANNAERALLSRAAQRTSSVGPPRG